MPSLKITTTLPRQHTNPRRQAMKASREQIAEYEKLALERGGRIGMPMSEAVASCRLDGETQVVLPFALDISEKEFQDKHVIPYAVSTGWLVYHTYDSRKSEPGYPDLTMFRPDLCQGPVWFELKDETGKLTKDQKKWRDAILKAAGAWYLMRPSDWNEIQQILQ